LAAVALTLVMPLGVYLLAAVAAATMDGQAISEVICFEPGRFDLPAAESMSAGRMVCSVLMALGAVAFLLIVPGLLAVLVFRQRPGSRPAAHAWSLAANSAALMLICLILRHTLGIGRFSLATSWLAWTAVLLVLAWRRGRSLIVTKDLWSRYGGGLLIGLLGIGVAIVAMFPEQFLQCFSGDGTEVYVLAESLQQHFLPHFELETWQLKTGNRLGTAVVNPSLINSYWTFALQVLLGGKELPTRLPYWIWWLGIFIVSYRIVRPESRSGRTLAAILLALSVFLSSLLYTFYMGYYPYMADLANPGVTDALFTLSVLLALDCLRAKNCRGFVVSIVMASLVLYAGPVLLLTILAAAWVWRPIERPAVRAWGLRAVGVLTAIAAFYLVWGGLEGVLPAWMETLDLDYVNDYMAEPAPLWKSGPLFFAYFVLGCGGLPAWGLARAFRLGRWEKTVATATLLYLAIVLSAGAKNLHYLGPLLPITMILFLIPRSDARGTADAKRAGRECRAIDVLGLLAAGSLIVCIALCWPKMRTTFTLNRQLGTNTVVLTDSRIAAYRWARLHQVLEDQGKVSWHIGPHTWATYARWNPKPARLWPFVLSGGEPPSPTHVLIASRRVEGTGRTARLYAQNEPWVAWLATRQARPPLERYPIVMRPLADGPYSPHNSGKEDVPRLKWP